MEDGQQQSRDGELRSTTAASRADNVTVAIRHIILASGAFRAGPLRLGSLKTMPMNVHCSEAYGV